MTINQLLMHLPPDQIIQVAEEERIRRPLDSRWVKVDLLKLTDVSTLRTQCGYISGQGDCKVWVTLKRQRLPSGTAFYLGQCRGCGTVFWSWAKRDAGY